jgi:hypothetical protein
MTDLERLAEEWLEERRMGSASGVWHRVQILAELQPEQAWALTQILLRATKPQPRDNALRIHVAGILNRILERYLAEFIDRVESEAGAEPLFKELLAHISLPSDAAPIATMERLRNASDGSVTIYPAPSSELARVAYDVADRYRSGQLPSVPPATRFPVPLLAKEIARLVPGHSEAEYSIAAARALQWSR